MTDVLQGLHRLVGEWTTEMTHPAFPSLVVHGRTTFEWLTAESFLIVRSTTDHPDFPDSVSVIGDTDGLQMHYFDERGVHRVYEVDFTDDAWEWSRDAPGFSQRFRGEFDEKGATITGLSKLCRDDRTWADDLRITYRRTSGERTGR